jgi:hypothetical protein
LALSKCEQTCAPMKPAAPVTKICELMRGSLAMAGYESDCKRSFLAVAVSDLVFGVAALQKQPGLFVAFLVQIMEQRRVGVAGQLFGQFVKAVEERQEVRFGIRGGHRLDRVFQFDKRAEQIFFKGIFHRHSLSRPWAVTMCFWGKRRLMDCLAGVGLGMDWIARTIATLAAAFVLAGLLAGCATPINWQARVGVTPGPYAYGPVYYGRGYYGPVGGGYSTTYFPAQFLRLIFSLDGKLKAWKEFSK